MSRWGEEQATRRPGTALEALSRRRPWGALGASVLLAAAVAGCRYNNYAETIGNDTSWVDSVMAEVDAGTPPEVVDVPLTAPITLKTLQNTADPEYQEMTLDEVIAYAMANSKVLRDLGGTILSQPQTITTQYSKGIVETDPRFGMEGALSVFDAQLNALASFQNNDRVFNNRFLGGGGNFFRQARHDYLVELSKLTATGTQFALRNITDYDDNNAPGNIFGSAWQTQFEGTVRQPLLQGGGVTFNRIAGPYGTPGFNNGILVAKVNTDINSQDFDAALRNYLSDVYNAYWDLYYSYRDLDSKQQALQKSRETWQAYQAEAEADRRGGVSEALAREQFYRFQSDLEDAIAGRVGQRTQNRLPVNDNRLLRPVSEPQLTPIVFDWDSMAMEAVTRRPELQRQRLVVKRNELELIANKNFLQPRLDLYGTYRVRGLGHDLAGGEIRDGLRSALGETGTFEHREWEAGVELSVPIGFRQAHAAVENAELLLSRNRAVLHEQERQVLHDLSTQVAEVDRAWQQVQANLNRYLAAKDAVDALDANREVGLPVNLEQVLDAQRRVAEAQSNYHLARTEYAIALKNVHLEKGSLLDYSNVLIVDSAPKTDSADPEVGDIMPGEEEILKAAHEAHDAARNATTTADATSRTSNGAARVRVDLSGDDPSTPQSDPAAAAHAPGKVSLDAAPAETAGKVSLDAEPAAPQPTPSPASAGSIFATPSGSGLFD
jgi:outer membrane protein TolC